jgi:hypothetical protein
MKRALTIAAGLLVLVPSAAEARALSAASARSAAQREVSAQARQEPDGRAARVESCSRRSALRARCRVSFSYTESTAYRGGYTPEKAQFEDVPEERKCTATVLVQLSNGRARNPSAVLINRTCRPFFDHPPE